MTTARDAARAITAQADQVLDELIATHASLENGRLYHLAGEVDELRRRVRADLLDLDRILVELFDLLVEAHTRCRSNLS